ncbi:MAG TPA: hypothetical protein VNT56_06750 [Acidimicrobiales bacterium]|nr:hypothetical protein [Acidimicrobiales bacterium]
MTAIPVSVEVQILQLPIALYHRSAEHHDELRREFALLRGGQAGGQRGVPDRLTEVMAGLEARFGAVSAGPEADIAAAAEAGSEVVDLTYHVPIEARDAVEELGRLLDEADEFCRQGDHLLTLAAPPEILAFRRWFLRQFLSQLDGGGPSPWQATGAGSSTGA